MREFKAYVDTKDFRSGAVLHLAEIHPDGRISTAGTAEFLTHEEPFGHLNQPALLHGRGAIQAIVDAAYEAGFRPTAEASPIKGEVNRLEKHLDDMRAIAGKAVGVEFK